MRPALRARIYTNCVKMILHTCCIVVHLHERRGWQQRKQLSKRVSHTSQAGEATLPAADFHRETLTAPDIHRGTWRHSQKRN